MNQEDQKQEIREWCKEQTVERLKEVVDAHKDASNGARYWLCLIATCELERRDDISEWKSYVDIADAIKATDAEITGAKEKVWVVVGPDRHEYVRALKACRSDKLAWAFVRRHSNEIGSTPSCYSLYALEVEE